MQKQTNFKFFWQIRRKIWFFKREIFSVLFLFLGLTDAVTYTSISSWRLNGQKMSSFPSFGRQRVKPRVVGEPSVQNFVKLHPAGE